MRDAFTTHPLLGNNPAPTRTLKAQMVSPTEMEKPRKQGLHYYYDEKYSSRH
jgi:hypothetical protein